MELIDAKLPGSSRGKKIAILAGSVILSLWLIANALPAASVIESAGENPGYATGFLIAFFGVIAGCLTAIIYGLKK